VPRCARPNTSLYLSGAIPISSSLSTCAATTTHSRSAEAASANSVQANTSPGSSANKGTNRAGPARATHPREVLGDERGGEDAARRRHWGRRGTRVGIGMAQLGAGAGQCGGIGGFGGRELELVVGEHAAFVRRCPVVFARLRPRRRVPPRIRVASPTLAVPRRRLV